MVMTVTVITVRYRYIISGVKVEKVLLFFYVTHICTDLSTVRVTWLVCDDNNWGTNCTLCD